MKRAIILSVLVIGTLASASDFPAFNDNYSHCEIKAIYKDKNCDDTYTRMSSII